MLASCHITSLSGILLLLCVQCSAQILINPCGDVPGVRGPCSANLRRFTFAYGRCVPFYYGGCLGTRNRFDSFVECERRCLGGPCNQTPGVVGRCYAAIPRYTYVPFPINSCVSFTYGGCEGNDNNFEDVNVCFNLCVFRRG
uniref:BPTI/Kunitz domain-containing protein 2 n=1 Tax=Margaritifera margaritifera TaxID=102329 RepID=KCP2_PINMG|nr:RecName: Full=BPTI/Kunitz domain-containing protein 2; AltName: Full=Prism serine protease inhibitor 2; Short=PISP2; Flags: Precursor [Pinctada margaritifera]CCE46172.1 prism serine protease inhibitor 2 [Pinctada margaritifera]